MVNIPDNIIERAAELWTRFLRKPTFDNGDTTGRSAMASAMATVNAPTHTEETLQAFKSALTDYLKFMRDHDGEEIPEDKREPADQYGRIRTHYRFDTSLSVDYDPDEALHLAAIAAGITGSKTVFPWKTDVYLRSDSVMVSAGYRAQYAYHYPLSDGRWFITDLNGGDDMRALIDVHIETGLLYGVGKIEEASE